MNNAHEILTKINWFLEPISNLILYLFTTKTGFFLLVLSAIIFLFIPALDAVRVRQLQVRSAANFGSGRLTLVEKIYVASKTMFKNITKIVNNAPVLLIVFLLMFFIVGISTGIKSIDTFVQNEKRISELKTVFKQLDKRYKVAEIEILNYNYVEKETTLEVKFFDSSISDFTEDKQEITIKGNDIYFDAVVINFDYSQISEGNSRTLVLPYRIFSNTVSQSEGIALKYKDNAGIPLIFKRNKNDVYGISVEKYNKYLEEFAKYIEDENFARQAGVRSLIGNAVHKKVRKGQKLIIWAEQTGGIVIKLKKEF